MNFLSYLQNERLIVTGRREISPISFVVLVSVASASLPVFDSDHPDRIAGQYIVIYPQNTTADFMARHVKQYGASENNEIFHVYNINDEFKGFAARLDDASLQLLLDDPFVQEVHADRTVRLEANSCGTQQTGAPWGLCRTSAWDYTSRNSFFYDPNTAGWEVDVYIIDTGCQCNHPEFAGGRCTLGGNYASGPNADQNGHGTHCAGTAAGSTVGIAKSANIVAVRVLGADGSGTLNGVIAGCNEVGNRNSNRPCVGSMSLGASYSAPVNNAVTACVNSGCTMVVAAGNSNANACNFSPASTPSSICVGATNSADNRATFSNFGNCVHCFAPGQDIYSSWIGSTYRSISGTSMACPHVAGQAAVILSENPNFTPAQCKARIVTQSQKGLIGNVGAGSPNNLLYNGCDDA